jgi:beta-lactam-binding protein with PASTA domain
MDWKKPLEIGGVIFVVVLLAYLSFNWAMEGVVHARKQVQVPDLKGKSVLSALDALAQLNLTLRKEGSEFDSSVPGGAILRQLPPPGTMVREGKTIRVIISHGGETVFTPTVVGLPLRNAEMMLRQKQLLLGEVSESYSLRVDKGVVLSQDPSGDRSVEKNSLVNVVVSGGAPPSGIILMPDFRQKAVGEAAAWASGVKIEPEVTEDPGSLFPSGTVLGQEPAPDAIVSSNLKVRFTVSARPKGAGPAVAVKHLHYEVSQGSQESLVRIVVVDSNGEREVFNGLRAPGSKIDLDIPQATSARVRIFINGILVEEKVL